METCARRRGILRRSTVAVTGERKVEKKEVEEKEVEEKEEEEGDGDDCTALQLASAGSE